MRLAATSCVFVIFALAGCAATGEAKPSAVATAVLEEQEPSPEAIWPFWPTTMRVHPLTRIATNPTDGTRLLEARIEFEDAYGHTTKAFGFLRFELIDGAARHDGVEPVGWNIDLRNLDANANHFDEVSRTYLTRLRLDEKVAFADPILRARFNSLNGVELDAEARVRR